MKLTLFLLPFIGSVLALSIRNAEVEAAPCTCEPVFCTQAWPDSCYCANDAKKACYDKCGGNIPVYNVCPPRAVTARAPKPKPTTPPPSTCVCDTVFCAQSWPESCHCQNNAKKACFDKCGGEEPTYQTCPPAAPPAPAARSESTAECKCTEVNCIQMWPAGCYCANYAKELCYKECGGEKPVLNVCPPLSTPSLTTRIIAATPRAVRQASHSKPTNQLCGGGRGSPFPACPSGQVCIPDPFARGSCGPACGEAGICVEDKMCGGFAGFACDKEGQVCVDDPRDDCDPQQGSSDCAGVCVWPQ